MSRILEAIEEDRKKRLQEATVGRAGDTLAGQRVTDISTGSYVLDAIEEEKRKTNAPEELPAGPYAFQRGMANAVTNIPSSAAGVAGDIANAVMNPIDTLSGVGELLKAGGNKLGRSAAELVHGQEMEPMESRPEVAADVAGQAIADRYGSPGAVGRTLMNDPVGAGLDIFGIGGAASNTLRKLEPTGVAGRGAQDLLGRKAIGDYGRAAGLPKSMSNEDYLRLVDAGLSNEIIMSRKGLDKLEGIQGQVLGKINEKIDNASYPKGHQFEGMNEIPVSEINQYLNDLQKSLEGTSGGSKNIAELQKMKRQLYKEFSTYNPETKKRVLKEKITPQEMQKFKTQIYRDIYDIDALQPDKSRNIKTRVMREQGRGAKASLENRIADLEDLNTKWGDLQKLSPWVKKSIDRVSEMEPGFAKVINSTMRNPKARSQIAIAMKKMADGDMGWAEKNLNTNQIRVALALSGRNEEMLDERTNF